MRYQSKAPKRRFLAGVKCPKCEAMDAVVQVQLFEPVEDEYIECTTCGHSERRPDADVIVKMNNVLDEALNHASATGTSGVVKFKP